MKGSKPSAEVLRCSQVEHRLAEWFLGTLDCCQQKEKIYTIERIKKKEKV